MDHGPFADIHPRDVEGEELLQMYRTMTYDEMARHLGYSREVVRKRLLKVATASELAYLRRVRHLKEWPRQALR